MEEGGETGSMREIFWGLEGNDSYVAREPVEVRRWEPSRR